MPLRMNRPRPPRSPRTRAPRTRFVSWRACCVTRVVLSAVLCWAPTMALAQPSCAAFDDAGCVSSGARLPSVPSGVRPAVEGAAAADAVVIFFWAEGCSHCDAARPVIVRLAAEVTGLRVEALEVRRDRAGRARFLAEVARLGIRPASVPLFVRGNRWEMGFDPVQGPARLRALVRGEPSLDRAPGITWPLLGRVEASRVSLPTFTLLVGLLDGFNPCAFYVLFVLLGILLHVPSRARVALYGATFVVTSGVVYFLFMGAWLNAFARVGDVRGVTRALGVVLLGMGVINLKELVWFKQGMSLMIPAEAKPGLFRRVRGIARAATLPAALAGITALAFVVNLIELGCTLGLPAMYTRVLSLQPHLSPAARYAYLALYNVAYVVPLGLIVTAYGLTLRRIELTARRARALKALSGALLVLFGLLFVFAPERLRP